MISILSADEKYENHELFNLYFKLFFLNKNYKTILKLESYFLDNLYIEFF